MRLTLAPPCGSITKTDRDGHSTNKASSPTVSIPAPPPSVAPTDTDTLLSLRRFHLDHHLLTA